MAHYSLSEGDNGSLVLFYVTHEDGWDAEEEMIRPIAVHTQLKGKDAEAAIQRILVRCELPKKPSQDSDADWVTVPNKDEKTVSHVCMDSFALFRARMRQQKRCKYCGHCNCTCMKEHPQGWREYPGDICKHGMYTGGIGIDWICGPCEQGDR